jgi:hypothetical protein
MFKGFIAYLKDNPEHYWFKAKYYGWGWTPATTEGWLVILIFILFIIWRVVALAQNAVPTTDQRIWFFAEVIGALVALLLICWKTGESLRWQWGNPKDDRQG